MSDDSMNGADRRAPGRGTSHRALSPSEDSFILAIGDVGKTVDELKISVERQIRALTEYVNQCERNHQTDMGHWRTVTEELAQLLHIKTQATQEVSSSYMRLAEQLAKFNNYLMMSEMTLGRVEQPLLSLSKALPSLSEYLGPDQNLTLSGMNPAQIKELLQAIKEDRAANQQMQDNMKQTLGRIQRSAITSQPENETSILTDLTNWRAALVWVGIGAVATSGLLFWVFRGSGFNQAMKAMNLQGGVVDARLERIEIWLGIVEDEDDRTADFEEKPFPEE